MRYRSIIVAVFVSIAALPQVRAQGAPVEKIPLRHADVRTMVETIGQPLPEGIRSLAPFDLENALLVVGTREGVAGLRQAVAILDKPAVQLRIEAEGYSIEPGTLARDVPAGISNPREQGVFTGDAAEKLAAAVRQPAGSRPGRTIVSPRVTTMSGRMAMIQTQVNEGPGYMIQVTPEVHGKTIRAFVLAFEGTQAGTTYTGRLVNERVEVPIGGAALFWMSPTKTAPNDLVVLLRFETLPLEPLAPALSTQ